MSLLNRSKLIKRAFLANMLKPVGKYVSRSGYHTLGGAALGGATSAAFSPEGNIGENALKGALVGAGLGGASRIARPLVRNMGAAAKTLGYAGLPASVVAGGAIGTSSNRVPGMYNKFSSEKTVNKTAGFFKKTMNDKIKELVNRLFIGGTLGAVGGGLSSAPGTELENILRGAIVGMGVSPFKPAIIKALPTKLSRGLAHGVPTTLMAGGLAGLLNNRRRYFDRSY